MDDFSYPSRTIPVYRKFWYIGIIAKVIQVYSDIAILDHIAIFLCTEHPYYRKAVGSFTAWKDKVEINVSSEGPLSAR